jgi:hypothetical protein
MADPQVSGGTHSSELVAAFADMRVHSEQLRTISAFLFDQGGRTVQVAFDGDLLESAVLSPLTASNAESTILSAASMVTAQGVQVTVLHVFLDGAVATYEAADAAISRTLDALAFGAGFVVGAVVVVATFSLAELAAVAGAVYVGAVEAVYQVGELFDATGQAWDAVVSSVEQNPWLLATVLVPGMPGALQGVAVNAFASAYSPTDAALAAAQKLAADFTTLVGLLPSTDELGAWAASDLLPWLEDHPYLADLLVRLAPGMLAGSTFIASLELGVNPGLTFGALSAASGGPWPPLDIDQAIDRIIGLGSHFGAFADDTGDFTFIAKEFLDEKGEPPRPPTDLESLFESAAAIDRNGDSNGDGVADVADIRVVQQVDGSGNTSWIVQIPSTQYWSPIPGNVPNDLSSDVWAVGQRETVLMEAVKRSMELAGIGSEDPVMLTGFSLGGITAGELGSDPWMNSHYNITNVVVCGSSIARFDFPPDVQVTAFEIRGDLVPLTDGMNNPGTPNEVTVRADNPKTNSPKPHDAKNYAAVAAQFQASGDPNAVRFMESTQNFFSGETVVVYDYAVMR